MSLNTRSRRAATTQQNETSVKPSTQNTAASKKSKSNSKKNLEDENITPPGKVAKISRRKANLAGAKLHVIKESNTSSNVSNVSLIKSPALRDRTNTTSRVGKVKESSKKTDNLKSDVDKKTVAKKNIKNLKSTNEENVKEEVKVSKIKNSVKKSKTESTQYSVNEIKKLLNEEAEVGCKRSRLRKTTKDSNKKDDTVVVNTEKLNVNNKVKSTKINVRKKNISDDKVELILNENDEADDKTNIISIQKENSKNSRSAKDTHLNVDENEKCTEDQKVEKNKSEHSEFSDLQKESARPAKKILRRKALKNYCELSQLSDNNKLSKVIKFEDQSTVSNENDKKDKNLPIYKTIRQSQEKETDIKEVYDFPDDSQESKNTGKKRKKPVKRPVVKRARKAANLKLIAPQKKEKLVKKKPNTNQIESEKCTEIFLQDNTINSEPVDHKAICQNVEDTVAAEVSPSIKILADQKLEGSKRVNIMATPYVPKTITSELKLFGPKNAITSQPTSQYNKMVNHSLIRKSMSPITKVEEEFDTGSPWRPVDTFSRIKKVVQSTPQVKRPPFKREKKNPLPMHISEKSINSADTIHISSIGNDKSSLNSKKKDVEKQNEISPNRQFGTEISNTSPSQSKFAENIYEAKTILQSNKKTPIQTTSLQTTVVPKNSPSPTKATYSQSIDDTLDEDIFENSAISNKENIEPIANEETKNEKNEKNSSGSEKAQTMLNSPESFSKLSETNDKKTENKKCEPKTFKQTNLNKFLNLDEIPESTNISSSHGIFKDVCSTPINAKTQKKIIEELNVENAFGFDDCDVTDDSPTVENVSCSNIATVDDVEQSVKGKLFVKARVKSALPSRNSRNTIKKAALQNALQKKEAKKENSKFVEEKNKNTQSTNKNEENSKDNYEPISPKKAILEAVSFSDTFDVLSENGDLESKIPEEVPLFVDLEPVHFSQPPRRSYHKRKRGLTFDNKDPMNDDDEDEKVERKKPRTKKKKESKLSKEEQKRMQDWVKSINDTFEEIDHFDLVVE